MTVDPGRTRFDTGAPTPTRPAFARLATPRDRATLGRLRAQALADIDSARGGLMYLERNATDLPAVPEDWSNLAERVWLGGLGDRQFGYLVGAAVPTRSGAHVGVIEAIFVETEARACGIGEAMLSAALAWFSSLRCVGVESTALPGDRATKNFFEEHGLKARLITVYRSLGGEDRAPADD